MVVDHHIIVDPICMFLTDGRRPSNYCKSIYTCFIDGRRPLNYNKSKCTCLIDGRRPSNYCRIEL